MLDQAHDLRRLAVTRGLPTTVDVTGRPTLLAVTGGKGGVGTTTIAINIAAAMTETGGRALLVDADPRGGDAGLRCRTEERHTLADLLEGRRTWAEVIETVPEGIRLVAGTRWSDDFCHGEPSDRLLEQLSDAGKHADVAIIDVGNGASRAAERIIQAADAIVMVTTGETAAVVSTFAAIRALVQFARQQNDSGLAGSPFVLHLLVNMARTDHDAQTVHHRLGRACRRLLGIELTPAGATGSASRRLSVPLLPLGGGVGCWSRLLHLETVCPKTKKG
jgi:flagellar biosynthesis protein FlhG